MPAPELSNLCQTALLWPAVGYDQYGQPTVGPVVELSPPYDGVQWINKKREVLDRQGNTISIDATVVVARKIAIGSHMWFGSLEEWYGEAGTGSGSGSGGSDDDLCEVKTFDEQTDLKGRVSRRTVGLMRLHNCGGD